MHKPDSIPPSQSPAIHVGRHVFADLHGVDEALLQDEAQLMTKLVDALDEHGFHQLAQHSHKFPGPGGVTGFILLSESHAAFHSYPEYGYIAVDVFSCGMADPEPVIEHLQQSLGAQSVQAKVVTRGPH